MSGTKIKGHRISDNSIKKRHLDLSDKLNENELNLNFETHSNEADLNLEQKNTLTQGGNADSLHFHNGGGGGANGIYTNEERDAQILRMSMMINATGTGLDKSVRDNLNDDDNVQYPIKAANAPKITVSPEGGSMNGGTAYTYGVSYKNKYGKTNVVSTRSATTPDSVSSSIELILDDVPDENTGLEIYRGNGFASDVIKDFSDASKDNIFDSGASLFQKGENGKNSIVSEERSWDYSNYPDRDILNGFSTSEVDESLWKKNVNIDLSDGMESVHILVSKKDSRPSIARIGLWWGEVWGDSPDDYELYYSNERIPTGNFDYANNHISWKPVTGMYVGRTQIGTVTDESTDGIIQGNRVTGNHNNLNNFFLEKPLNIISLKVVVKKATRQYKTNILSLHPKARTGYGTMIAEIKPFSSQDYNIIWVDVKSQDLTSPILQFMSDKDEPLSEEYIMNFAGSSSISGKYVASHNYSHYYSKYRLGFYRNSFSIMSNSGALEEFKFRGVAVQLADTSSHYPHTSSVSYSSHSSLTFNKDNYISGLGANDSLISDYSILPCTWTTSIFSVRIFINREKGALGCYGISSRWSTFNNAPFACIDRINDNSSSNSSNLYNKHICGDFGDFGVMKSNQTKNRTVRTPIVIPKENELNFNKLAILYGTAAFEIGNITASEASISSGVIKGPITDISYVNKEVLDKAAKLQNTPTVDSPKVIVMELDSMQEIDSINYHVLNSKDYRIQYTKNINAENDDLHSGHWIDVKNVKFTFEDLLKEYDGAYEISGSRIRNLTNDIGNIVHLFDKVEAIKVRVVIYSSGLDVYNFRPMLIGRGKELRLLHKVDTKIEKGYQFLDDGKSTIDISPNEFNTTGSSNVKYNKDLKLIELQDRGKEGIVYFKDINVSLYRNIMLSSQAKGELEYYASNDNGITFEKINIEDLYSFSSQSRWLTLKVVLKSSDAMLNAIGVLYSL